MFSVLCQLSAWQLFSPPGFTATSQKCQSCTDTDTNTNTNTNKSTNTNTNANANTKTNLVTSGLTGYQNPSYWTH